MILPDGTNLSEVAKVAYRRVHRYYEGFPVPTWDQLSQKHRDAWTHAVADAFEEIDAQAQARDA